MTISSTDRRAGPYLGDDIARTFPFDFKVFARADVRVVRTALDGVEATLMLDAEYAVTLNADQNANPGGSVKLFDPLGSGFRLTIGSGVALTQPTSLTSQGGFYPKVLENALDRATVNIQQQVEVTDRTLKLPFSTDMAAVSTTLPAPAANTLLGWDASGTGLRAVPFSEVGTIADPLDPGVVIDVDALADIQMRIDRSYSAINGVTIEDGTIVGWIAQADKRENGPYSYDATLGHFVRDVGEYTSGSSFDTAVSMAVGDEDSKFRGQVFTISNAERPIVVGTTATNWVANTGATLTPPGAVQIGGFGPTMGNRVSTSRRLVGADLPHYYLDQANSYRAVRASIPDMMADAKSVRGCIDARTPLNNASAINAALSRERVLDLKDQVITLTSAIVIPSGRKLIANGGGRDGPVTIRVLTPNLSPFQIGSNVELEGVFKIEYLFPAVGTFKGVWLPAGVKNVRHRGEMVIVNAAYGIWIDDGCEGIDFDRVTLVNQSAAGIRVLSSAGSAAPIKNVKVRALFGSTTSASASWCTVDKGADGFRIDRADVTGGSSLLVCSRTGGSAGDRPKNILVRDAVARSTSSHAFAISNADTVTLRDCVADTAGGNGFNISTDVQGRVVLDAPTAIASAAHGIALNPNLANVTITAPACSGNSRTTSNTSDGISIANNTNNVKVFGGRCAPRIAGDTSTQRYGVAILGTTHADIVVDGVDVAGNVTAGAVNQTTSSTTTVIRNCNGYNGTFA